MNTTKKHSLHSLAQSLLSPKKASLWGFLHISRPYDVSLREFFTLISFIVWDEDLEMFSHVLAIGLNYRQ